MTMMEYKRRIKKQQLWKKRVGKKEANKQRTGKKTLLISRREKFSRTNKTKGKKIAQKSAWNAFNWIKWKKIPQSIVLDDDWCVCLSVFLCMSVWLAAFCCFKQKKKKTIFLRIFLVFFFFISKCAVRRVSHHLAIFFFFAKWTKFNLMWYAPPFYSHLAH